MIHYYRSQFKTNGKKKPDIVKTIRKTVNSKDGLSHIKGFEKYKSKAEPASVNCLPKGPAFWLQYMIVHTASALLRGDLVPHLESPREVGLIAEAKPLAYLLYGQGAVQ